MKKKQLKRKTEDCRKHLDNRGKKLHTNQNEPWKLETMGECKLFDSEDLLKIRLVFAALVRSLPSFPSKHSVLSIDVSLWNISYETKRNI